MLEAVFSNLYNALYGNPAVTLIAAFVWGLASVLLSPCHLSSIPLVLAFLTGKKSLKVKDAFLLSLIFSLGILFSFIIVGAVTIGLGRMAGDLGSHANLVFGIALVIGGILLADLLPLGNISLLSRYKFNLDSKWSYLVVGLLFGLALGPCAFAFMAPVLGLAFSLADTKPVLAIAALGLYALGHCAVIVAAGTSLTWVQKLLNWNEKSKKLVWVKRICALLVVSAGIYMIFK